MSTYTDISIKEPIRVIEDVEVILQRLEVLLTSEPGDFIDKPMYGTPLRQFLYENITTMTAGLIRLAVKRSIDTWMNDVFEGLNDPKNITVHETADGQGFQVQVSLTIKEFDKNIQLVKSYLR